MRTEIEIKAEIANVENRIFMEKMADFMDWNYYYKLKTQLNDLQKELEKIQISQ